MDLLFLTHRTHVPDASGGAPRSMHALLSAAASRHRCSTVCALPRTPRTLAFRAMRYATGRRLRGWRDRRAGYDAYRTLDYLVPALAHARLTRRTPNLAVVDAGHRDLVETVRTHAVPVLMRAVDTLTPADQLPRDPRLTWFANSHFVAQWLRRHQIGPAEVVYPIIDVARYQTDTRAARCVTFINPRPLKGLELALEIARRLPATPFLFVESWPLPAAARRALEYELRACPNVTLCPPARDMRDIYAQTRVLLVPSLCDEAFGRVVIEAHASGIPVVARASGGLPESVGEGGLVLATDATIDDWSAAVGEVAAGGPLHQRLSEAARANTQRPELAPAAIAARFLALVERQAA